MRAVHANYARPDDAGIRTRFAPFWEANVQRFQQSVVAAVTDGEPASVTARPPATP